MFYEVKKDDNTALTPIIEALTAIGKKIDLKCNPYTPSFKIVMACLMHMEERKNKQLIVIPSSRLTW